MFGAVNEPHLRVKAVNQSSPSFGRLRYGFSRLSITSMNRSQECWTRVPQKFQNTRLVMPVLSLLDSLSSSPSPEIETPSSPSNPANRQVPLRLTVSISSLSSRLSRLSRSGVIVPLEQVRCRTPINSIHARRFQISRRLPSPGKPCYHQHLSAHPQSTKLIRTANVYPS